MRAPLLEALAARGAVLLDAAQKSTLATLMWPDGKLSPAVIGQSATVIAERAGDVGGADRAAWRAIAAQQPRILMVEEDGVGHDHPYLGREALAGARRSTPSPTSRRPRRSVERIYAYEGAGHSVGLNTADDEHERALELGLTLPVSRVIVNQAHCIATGGSFDNGLPFSLSMGCGTWGRNNFSDNMNYRHYLNITRIVAADPERVPSEREIFGAFFDAHGKGMSRGRARVFELIERRRAARPDAVYAIATDGRAARSTFGDLRESLPAHRRVARRDGLRAGRHRVAGDAERPADAAPAARLRCTPAAASTRSTCSRKPSRCATCSSIRTAASSSPRPSGQSACARRSPGIDRDVRVVVARRRRRRRRPPPRDADARADHASAAAARPTRPRC